MTWNLEIEFGGLCMFVKSPSLNAVFVLMPRAKTGMHVHDACVQIPALGLEYHSIEERAIDLTPFAIAGANTVIEPGLAPVSHIAADGGQKVPVNDRLLTDPVGGALLARVRLPSGIRVQPTGIPALLLPEGAGTPSRLYGRCTTKVRIDDRYDHVMIGDQRVEPVNGASASIRIANAPESDRVCNCQRSHSNGDEAPHFQFYYDLLAPGPLPVRRRRMFVAQNVVGDPGCDDCHAMHANMIRNADRVARGMAYRFIDPYFCTVGSGCESGDATC